MKIIKWKMLLITLALLTAFSSCSKYEDGPGISLRTKKARLAGDWQLEELEIDGTDFTADINVWDLEFTKDGEFTQTFQVVGQGSDTEGGEWSFSNDKEEIELKFDSGENEDLEISRLTNNELWFTFLVNYDDGTNEKYDCKFESQ